MTNRERFRAAPLKALEENAVVSIGGVLLVGLFLLLCPRLRARRRGVTLAALSVVANLLLIRGFLELGERPEVITYLGNDVFFWMAPMTLAAVITAILGGIPLAILATFIVSFFATLMLGRSIDIFLVFALASLTGVYCCRRVRDRGTLFRAGFWVGGVSAAGVFFVCLIGHELSWPFIGNALVLTAFSGFMTCIAIMVLVPILEKIFHTASDFTLGELSTDSDHPLLRKLRIVAPGTSNHSASVASLAEAGAEAIGANDLLCRCSALFHDIGKIAKPEYFSENQGAENPHDKVTPAMSAMVIREHVAGGVKLAKEYNLPREIIDIIEQHHGTDLIKYFYFKAKEAAAANGSEVDEQAFRYDGPRPSTREAAIVMIADGLEASVRALKNHTPTEIRERVNAIINDRIKDGQFDESPLTFRELDRVREAMYNSLLTSYHHRVEYPQDPRARKSEGN
jgi:putative nucleotidyltransferase with HDIG domain